MTGSAGSSTTCYETMHAADGVGLAATQVDVHERVIVIDTSQSHDELHVLINPELVWRSEEMVFGDEGCLSVPETYDKVARHARVTVRALDRDGEMREIQAEGLLAVCVQHEMDHLIGKVFVEYLSPLKRRPHQDADAQAGARTGARALMPGRERPRPA